MIKRIAVIATASNEQEAIHKATEMIARMACISRYKFELDTNFKPIKVNTPEGRDIVERLMKETRYNVMLHIRVAMRMLVDNLYASFDDFVNMVIYTLFDFANVSIITDSSPVVDWEQIISREDATGKPAWIVAFVVYL